MKNLELLIKFNEEFLKISFENYFMKKNDLDVDDIIPIILYNSMIEKSKSILVLLNNNQFAGVDVIARSFFEQYVLLLFIIEKDSYNRSKVFHYSNALRNNEYAKEITENNHIELLGKFFGGKEKFEFIKTHVDADDEEIKNEFKELTTTNKSKHWFKIAEKNGIKINNFKELCKYLGDETYAEYLALYALLSQEAHGKDVAKYFTVSPNEFTLTYKSESDLPMVLIKEKLFNIPIKLSEYFKLKKEYQALKNRYDFQFRLNLKKKN